MVDKDLDLPSLLELFQCPAFIVIQISVGHRSVIDRMSRNHDERFEGRMRRIREGICVDGDNGSLRVNDSVIDNDGSSEKDSENDDQGCALGHTEAGGGSKRLLVHWQ